MPGIGDGVAGLIGGYGLYVGWRLGAPVVVLMRMLLNLGVETIIGSIPVAGDLFDIGFRGNLRNLALLERWLERPGETGRNSRWLLLGLGAMLVGSALFAVLTVAWFLGWLLRGG